MSRFIRATATAVVLLQAFGCGGSGSSGSSSPPVATGLVISPSSATVYQDEPLTLTAAVTYSDGSSTPVDAAWVCLDPEVLAVGSDLSSSITPAILATGTAQIRADFDVWSASATVEVKKAGLRQVFGFDDSGAIFRYPADGVGDPEAIHMTGHSMNRAFRMNRSNTKLWYIVEGWELWEFDPQTGTAAKRADLPGNGYCLWNGLDFDSQGRVILQGHQWQGGEATFVYRFDPATEELIDLGLSDYSLWCGDVLVGPDDCVYLLSFTVFSIMDPLISKFDPGTLEVSVWCEAQKAPDVVDTGVPAGFAMDADGSIYVAGRVIKVADGDLDGVDCETAIANKVYRFTDVNGDGRIANHSVNGVLVKEATVAGVLPALPPRPLDYPEQTVCIVNELMGIAVSPAGDLLVNILPVWDIYGDAVTGGYAPGIYRMLPGEDRFANPLSSGEVDHYNANPIHSGFVIGCLAVRR